MRKILALVALLCGAAGAYASDAIPNRYCDLKTGKQIIQFSSSDYRLDGKTITDDWTAAKRHGVWGVIYHGRFYQACDRKFKS